MTEINYEVTDVTATATEDYILESGLAIITAGELYGYIEFDIIDDDFDESDEVFSVLLTSANYAEIGSNDNLIFTILDNDHTLTVTKSGVGTGIKAACTIRK